MASTSFSAECVRSVNVTFTSVTAPVIPETAMVDGYGLAGPDWLADPVAGIAIEVEFVNVVGPSAAARRGSPSTIPRASPKLSRSGSNGVRRARVRLRRHIA